MRSIYPSYDIITDIESGINFRRAGFLKLIKRAIDGNLSTVVVAHKDRLVRFGFELLEWLFGEYKVALVVLDKQDFKTPEQELTEDLLSIVHVFSCRANGRRKYKPVQQEQPEQSNDSEQSDQSNESEQIDEPTITIVAKEKKIKKTSRI